jgi:hypothetical protein
MKRSWLNYSFGLILLFCFHAGFGQDTLVYRDGRVSLISDTGVDHAAGVLRCVEFRVPVTIPLTEIAAFSIGPGWYRVNSQGLISGPFERSGYKLGRTIFQSPAGPTARRFSISTNLISPFVNTWTTGYTYYANNSGNTEYPLQYYVTDNWRERGKMETAFATNRTFSIEPEINLSKRWSVKIPLVIGFRPKFESDLTQSEDVWNDYSYGSDTYIRVRSPFAAYALPKFDDYNSSMVVVYPGGMPGWNTYTRRHAKNLLFQVGIAPRFYPLGVNLKRAPYVSQSFNVGVGDAYAMDVYASFDTTNHKFAYWDESECWILYEEKIEIRKSPFIYFRYEALAGIDFVSETGWFFSLEAGVSTRFQNRGEADRYFVKIPGSDYQLLATEVLEFRNGIQPVARLNLGFKFGTLKLTEKN